MLCTSNCLMLRTERQRCQPCVGGRAMGVQLQAAQEALQHPPPQAAAQSAMATQGALQHPLPQQAVAQSAMATLMMPQRLGLETQNGLVMQLGLAMMEFPRLPGFGQELLEHPRLPGFGQELLEHFVEQWDGLRLQLHPDGLMEVNKVVTDSDRHQGQCRQGCEALADNQGQGWKAVLGLGRNQGCEELESHCYHARHHHHRHHTRICALVNSRRLPSLAY